MIYFVDQLGQVKFTVGKLKKRNLVKFQHLEKKFTDSKVKKLVTEMPKFPISQIRSFTL